MRPTRAGSVLAGVVPVLFAAGWLAGYPELAAYALGGWAALLVAVGLVVTGPLPVRAGRRVEPSLRVGRGTEAYVVISVVNASARRCPPSVLVDRVGDGSETVAVPTLRPGERCDVRYRLPTERRGVLPLGPLVAAREDPFGLVRRHAGLGAPERVLVHPSVHHVQPPSAGPRSDLDEETANSRPGSGVAFHDLREYVPGDDWRLIHWKATARRGDLVVRRQADPMEPALGVVLDTSAESHTPESFEECVSVAASVYVSATGAGVPVTLSTTGAGTVGDAVLDTLTEVQTGPDDGFVNLPRLAPPAAGTTVLLISGRPGAGALSAVATLAAAVPGLTLVTLLPREPVPGIRTVGVASAAEFAAAWAPA